MGKVKIIDCNGQCMTMKDIKKQNLDENGYEGIEEFQELDFDEKWQFLVNWMEETAKSVTALAKLIVAEQRRINAQGEEVEALAKSVIAVDVNKKLIRNVLKTGVLPTKELFKKEKDKLYELTKSLGVYM